MGAIASLVYTSVLAYKLRYLRAAAGPGGTNGRARKALGVVLLVLGAIMLFWGGMILVTLVNGFVGPSGGSAYASGQLVGRGIAGVLFVLLGLRVLSGGRRRHRQLKAGVTAISIAFLVASCAPRPSVVTGSDVERAKAFMASYADELRDGDREAMATRYHPDGAFIVGDGKKTFETHEETVAYYRAQWQQPQAFEWQDLSFEPAGSGAVVVIGRFNWQKKGATQGTVYSYTSLLVPVAGQLKIRVEDESGAQ